MNDNLKTMLEKNFMIIFGETNSATITYVEEAVAQLILKAITKPTPPDVTLLISTFGGRFQLEIYSLLKVYPGKITGFVVNNAQSSGSLILQACSERISTPNAKFLIHHGHIDNVRKDDLMDENKLKKFVEETKRSVKIYYEALSKRTGLSEDRIREICMEDRVMFSDEAIKLGLLDKVWYGPLPFQLGDSIKWPEEDGKK